MVAIVHRPQANNGSSVNLVAYLDKDRQSNFGFFTSDREHIEASEVVLSLDLNKSKLSAKEDKFYMLTLNPSHDELCSVIGRSVNGIEELSSDEKNKIESYLRELTKGAMNAYAVNFERESVKSEQDLLYYARIETTRIYKPTHENIKLHQRIGAEKAGLNYHVHVIVSRKSKDGKVKLSPNVISRGNDWELAGKATVRRGFNHEFWKREVQNYSNKLLGRDFELQSYQPKEDTVTRCKNKDLIDLASYRYTKSSFLVHEMVKRGYNIKKENNQIVFTDRRTKESFSVSEKDLRARESKFSFEERLKAWYEYTEKSYSFKAKDPDSEEIKVVNQRFFSSSTDKCLIGYNECYYAYLKSRSREQILSEMDTSDFKEALSNMRVCQYTEVISGLEQAGFSYEFDKCHVFTRGEERYTLSHKELTQFAVVPQEVIHDVASRLDLKVFKSCVHKENYTSKDISIEKHSYKDKSGTEKSYYLVRDKVTNSVSYLKDVVKESYSIRRQQLQAMRKVRSIQNKSGSLNSVSSQVVSNIKGMVTQNTIIGEVLSPMSKVQSAVSSYNMVSSIATDPATAISKQLLNQVKNIVFSSLKTI